MRVRHAPWLVVAMVAASVLATGIPASSVRAEQVRSEPVSGVVTCGDSDYQMIKATTEAGRSGVRWSEAQAEARNIMHRGQRARLAVIPNMQVHACVSEKLVPKAKSEAWIGLRYWCPYRKLQWATGEMRSHSEPSPWALQWSRYGTCQTQYVGVYYTRDSKRWQAVEETKGFRYMIVEFPSKEKDRKQQAAQ